MYNNITFNPVHYMTLHDLTIYSEQSEKVHFGNKSLRENNSFHIRFIHYSMLQHETLTHCLKVCFNNEKAMTNITNVKRIMSSLALYLGHFVHDLYFHMDYIC